MGAIAGIFGKQSQEACELVDEMLHAMKHRGARTRILRGGERDGIEAVGCSWHDDVQGRMIESDTLKLVLDGSFFGIIQKEHARLACKHFLGKSRARRAASHIAKISGSYAILVLRNKQLCALRDPNGLKPLYYSRTRGFFAFASERKALWRIGLAETMRVRPGYLYTVSRQGVREEQLSRISRPNTTKMTLRHASSRLQSLLEKSIRRVTKGLDRVAVAFSGGLDSAVIAAVAKQVHEQVELVSVGLIGSPELSTVQSYAYDLNLPITIEAFSPDSLEQYVRRVVWLIEEPNPMKVSVAVPLHWAAMVAAGRGFKVMLCGQGSDELYGGYYKYAKILDRKGRRALDAELYRSVIQASEVNYERDEQATSPFNVELRTPFADLDVIRFSLTIPSEFKVRPGNDLVRKWVLREVAANIDLPEDIVWRRKKAIQHGTGVENAIRKLAKQQGLAIQEYLTKIHAEVIKMDTMP